MKFEASLSTGAEISSQQRAQIDILIKLLLAMGLLIAVVGGLGLMGTMGMNILERTREIGVMRSIGAESGVIFQMVIIRRRADRPDQLGAERAGRHSDHPVFG